MRESYTNVKRRKVGGRAKMPKILKPLIGASLIMLIFAVYTILRSNTGADPSIEEDAQVSQYGNLAELEDPNRFMQAYLDANGGLEHLQKLQTMRINGVFSQGDNELKIFMLKRRPEMVLITYRNGPVEVTHGHAEGQFWVRSSTSGSLPTLREMSEDEKELMRKSMPMFGPLLSAYINQKARIESIQASDYNGETLLQVTVFSLPGNSAKNILVDPETMTIVSEYSTDKDGGKSLTEFFDYRSIREVMIPHRILTSRAGSEGSSFVIESIAFNVGASSSLFRADEMD